MAGEPAAEIQQLRGLKARLIEILSADADFVLQHADSSSLLSNSGYQQVRARTVPREKVTDLLDHIIQRGPEEARGLLELLKGPALQETFPMLRFLKDGKINTPSTGVRLPNSEDTVPSKQICEKSPGLVKEKQLMEVACAIGNSWKKIGILALEIPALKLEQIEIDQTQHIDRVFQMLLFWRTRQKTNATAAHLHRLLSQEHCGLPPESIAPLLEGD
uniref:Zgc:174906 n=1 Tax=Gasterosteus aculeatus aculeatus TaxID=481459 RepID=A0AAQ4PBB9_GASAC|nr:uncharacterized protein zgc:174906 isoform X1 [Gasterosteus aculeatus aculeatus]